MSLQAAEAISEIENLYLLDAQMMGLSHYGGLYILQAPRPAIIETGFSHTVEKILAALEELGIRPEQIAYILPTHVHMDHAGGAGFLAKTCPNAKIVVHERGVPHLIDPTQLVESVKRAVGPMFPYYGELTPIAPDRIMAVKGGERLELGDGYQLEIIAAPGHAPHQYCLYERRSKALFTGDAVGIYRREATGFTMTTPPPRFHYEQSLETLKKLRAFELNWLCFTHYGVEAQPYRLLDQYEKLLGEWVNTVERAQRELGDAQAVKEHFVQQELKELGAYYPERMLRPEVEMNVQGVLLYLQRERGFNPR